MLQHEHTMEVNEVNLTSILAILSGLLGGDILLCPCCFTIVRMQPQNIPLMDCASYL